MFPSIISDIYLLELYDRKYDLDVTTGINIDSLEQYEKKNNVTDWLFIKNIMETLVNIYPRVIKPGNKILDILTLGNGNISFCGVGLTQMAVHKRSREIDLYIHSCSKEKGEDLIKGCIELFGRDNYHLTFRHIIIRIQENCYIRICLDIYETKEQILKHNPCFLGTHGWNPIDGYFSLSTTLFPLFIGILPIAPKDDIVSKYEFYDICRNKCQKDVFYGMYYFFKDTLLVCNRFLPTAYLKLPFWEKPVLIPHEKNTSRCYTSSRCISIGISDDRYISFAHCRKKYFVPKDIFVLICDYWLEAETMDAKQRLLSY